MKLEPGARTLLKATPGGPMPPFLLAYLGSAAALVVLDAIWLTLAVPRE